jgi:methionine-rich copper-binding protein CopC
MFRDFLLTMFIILPMAAHAHSPLSSSFPSDGETLDVAPVEIVMDFKSPAKLIKVELMMSKDKEGNGFLGGLFGGDDGEPVPLGKSFLMSMNKRQVIPMPSLGEGDYSLSWRAMGEDGHVIKGELTFKVGGK